VGEFNFVGATDYVLAYERRLGDKHMLIALNMTDQAQIFRVGKSACEALLSTYLDDACPLHEEEIHLRANEGLVLRALPDVT
jgi:hypothetical protein